MDLDACLDSEEVVNMNYLNINIKINRQNEVRLALRDEYVGLRL